MTAVAGHVEGDGLEIPARRDRDAGGKFRLRLIHGVIVVLFGLALFLPATGGRVTLTRHEVLAAQPAREILEYGHWIIPTFAGKPRLVKPPTMGWTIALAMDLTGSTSERVVRLPSVIAATIVGLVAALLGARFGGSVLGLVAGLTQLTFYYVLMQGRLAEADMPLAACVAVAMYLFATAYVPGPGGAGAPRPTLARELLFHLAAAAAVCFKGPVGMAFVYPAGATYLILQRQRRGWGFLLGWRGLILFFCVAAAWPALAYHEFSGIVKVWRMETLGRVVGDLAGEEYHAWWYYGPVVLMLLAPWVPWTIVGLVRAVRRREWQSPLGSFLVGWFVPGFVVLSIVAWKHQHYAIPIMPALTLATAVGLVWWLRELRRAAVVGIPTAAMLLVSGCAGAVLIVNKSVPHGAGDVDVLIGLIALGGLAVLWMSRRRSQTGQIAALFGTAYAVALLAQILVMPYYDVYTGWTRMARAAAASVPAGQTTYLLGLHETQAAFYLNFPMQRCDTADEVRATFGAMHGPAYALTPVSMIPVLEEMGSVTPISGVDMKLRLPDKQEDRIVLVRFEPMRTGLARAGGD